MKLLKNIEEYVSVFIFSVIFLLMLVGIINRATFKFPLYWNFELARYSYVWLSFIGLGYVRRLDGHIRLDVFYNSINKISHRYIRRILWALKKALTFFFLVQLIYLGIIISVRSYRFKSQAMQIPQSFLYISVSIGALLYLINEILLSVHEFRAAGLGKQGVAS